METQEDRLRRMKREREGIASASWEPNPTAPREPSAASATWELNPTAPRNTGIAQGSWDEKPKPSNSVSVSWGTPESSTASVTWSPNTPEGLAAEITKPKPVFARTNKDGSPNYSVPKYGLPSGPVEKMAFDDRVMGGLDYVLGGDSIRNQLAYLDDVKSGRRGVDAPTSHHGLARHAGLPAEGREQTDMPVFKEGDTVRVAGGENWKPSPAMDVAPPVPKVAAAEEPKPAVVARPVGLQAPEVPQPAEAADRPKMVQQNPKAAVQEEQVPMPAKPMLNPQQRMLAGRSQWRNIEEKNAALVPHYQEAARQLGLDGIDGDTFGALSPEVAGKLQRKAHSLHRQSNAGQFNDRLSDRNQSREQNVPMALATAQRLQGRGRALLAQAGGLDESDPSKAALQAQGEQMLAQGNSQHATFMNAWERQSEQQIQQNVVRAAMIFGKAGAGIVEGHLRGQQEMARARLNDQGQRDDRIAAEAGMDRRANNRADVDLALADKNITAQEIEQQREREQRIAELKERERLHGLDQAQREKLAKDERDAAAHRQKLDLADKQKGRDAQAAQNPVPMQPAQQRAQLWEPLKAADSNPDDATPVQQYVDDFMQTLASQEGLQPQQRQIQGNQVKAWANQHVMSRWENDRLRDSDRGYIRSLVYATDAEGNNTGKLKDRSTFVREMGSHYKGSNWASMAAKLGAFYDRLQKEEKESANLTQVGIPDYPVV